MSLTHFIVPFPCLLSDLQTDVSCAWTGWLLNMQKYFYVFQNSRRMGISQGSSRDLTWKRQRRGPTMARGRAMPRGEPVGGLKKRTKPKKKRAGAIKGVRNTGRLTGLTRRRRTSPGAPNSTLPLAPSRPRRLPSPSTTRHITTSLEKTSCPERASGASRRKRRAAGRAMAVIIYFSLSRGKRSLSWEAPSDSAFQCVSGLHACDIMAICVLSMIK